jgi:hypothetical protein
MRLKSFIALIFIIGLQISAVSAQETISLKDVSDRVVVLEGHKENLDERFSIKMDELNSKFDRTEMQLKKDYDYIQFFAWLFGSVCAVSIIGSVFFCIRSIHKVAEQKINEKFESLFNEKREKLIQLINSLDDELNLKKSSTILVISPEETNETFFKRFFRKMGFERVSFIKHGLIFDKQSIDLILFNDEDDKFHEDDIIQYVENSNKSICFYFGGKRINCKGFEHIFSFANSKLQLYGNLINALKYKKLVD